jgi:predicted DNA-binding transcriptional regulator AlpA
MSGAEQQHSSPLLTAKDVARELSVSEAWVRDHVTGVESYVGARGAAEFLLRSPKTIQSWARAGIIPAHPVGCGSKKHWLFLKSELDAWVRSQIQTS